MLNHNDYGVDSEHYNSEQENPRIHSGDDSERSYAFKPFLTNS